MQLRVDLESKERCQLGKKTKTGQESFHGKAMETTKFAIQ